MTRILISLNVIIAAVMLILITCNGLYYGGNHSIIFGTWIDRFFQERLVTTIILTLPMIVLACQLRGKRLITSLLLAMMCFFIYHSFTGILAD